jgi:hypothetical protein
MLLAKDPRGLHNMQPARTIAASPCDELHAQTIVLLRWVLIVATAYLVLFSRPLAELSPAAALFIGGYLASNVLLGQLIPRLRAPRCRWRCS